MLTLRRRRRLPQRGLRVVVCASLPFPAALVPADTLAVRGACSALYWNNAVLDVVVVRPRRGLLRGVASKAFFLHFASHFRLPLSQQTPLY